MKALLAKEAREVGIPALVYFALATVFWFAFFDFEDVLLAPQTGPHMLVTLIAGTFGLLLGFGIFASERWRGTEGYLLHRGCGSGSVFLAKVLVGLAATLLLSAGPPLIFAVWQAWTSPLAPILQEARVIELVMSGTLGISVLAVGVLAAQLRRSGSVDAGLAVLVSLGLAIVAVVAPLNSSLPPTGIQLVIAAIVLPVAWWMFRARRDKDLSLTPTTHVVLSILALPLAVLPAYVLLASVRGLASVLLLASYPRILHDTQADEIFLASRESGNIYKRLGPSGLPVASISASRVHNPGERYIALFKPGRLSRGVDEAHWKANRPAERLATFGWSTVEQSVRGIGSRWFATDVFFDEDAGVLHAFYYETRPEGRSSPRYWPDHLPPPELPAHIVARKPTGNGRFSQQTFRPSAFSPSLLVDPLDETLWEVDVTRPSGLLEQVELPGGDRFVSLETILDRREARFGLRGDFWGAQVVLRGELAVYSWEGNRRFVHYRFSKEWEAPSQDLPRLQDRRLELVPEDPIAMGVEVIDEATGEVVFTHRYRPSGVLQRLGAGVVQAFACIGPPSVNLTSFFFVKSRERPDGRGIRLLEEPLLVGGKRPGLLAVHVVLIAVLTAVLLRRQRRTGVGAANRALSVVLILMAGVPAFLVLRSLCGRARAQTKRPDGAVRYAGLLIRTA